MIAPPVSELTFVGGQVLRDGQLSKDDLTIEAGQITASRLGEGRCVDLDGYYVLPGIVDLHGDAFERHIAPRPSAPFPIEIGLASTDRDAATNGVTTAWMAQSWSWEGGLRGPDFAEKFLAAHQNYRSQQLTDLRVQIRCETHTVDTLDRLVDALRTYQIDYLIFNNHLDETFQQLQDAPKSLTEGAKGSLSERMAMIRAAAACAPDVPRYLCNLATALDNLGIRYGSHDDANAETRERFAMIGAKICEFPTTSGAAVAAKTWGDPVLMGAPNVVRGGSQSGNISALPLIDENLVCALVSDYHYPSLHKAAFHLVERGMALPQAWAMISSNPAAVMGLTDRGTLGIGQRADLVIVDVDNQVIEGTIAGGRWSYLSHGLAQRLMAGSTSPLMAAE